MDAQFQNSSLRTLDGSHVYFFRMIDESPGDGFNQFLHRAPLQRTFAKFQREPGNRRPGQERVHRKTSTNKTQRTKTNCKNFVANNFSLLRLQTDQLQLSEICLQQKNQSAKNQNLQSNWLEGPACANRSAKGEQLRDFLLTNEAAHGVAGLCADSEPVLDAVGVELDLGGLFERVVGAHQFANAAIARAGALDHDDAIERSLLLANPRQTNRQQSNSS